MSDKPTIKAAIVEQLRRTHPEEFAIYFFMLVVPIVSLMLAGAGYLVYQLAKLFTGCGA